MAKKNSFISIILVTLLGSIFGFSLWRWLHHPISTSQIKPGMTAPVFALSNLTGKQISLSDFRGKVLIVNFWASWCPPCIEEMPSLQSLYINLQGRPFELIAVNIDEKEFEPRNIAKKLGLSFQILLDPLQKTTKQYNLTGVPETYIIDKNGIVSNKIIGPQNWTDPKVIAPIEELLQRS